MGLFKSKETDNTHGISGVISHGTPQAVVPIAEDAEVIDFPTVGLDAARDYLDDEDIELARRIRNASREELLGSAAVHLAKAEKSEDPDYAAFATAYALLASMRPPSEPQTT